MVFLQHLHIRVVWQALLADGREVGRLPAATVQVGLDLGRHGGREGVISVRERSNVWPALEYVWVGPAPVQLCCAFLLRCRRCCRGSRRVGRVKSGDKLDTRTVVSKGAGKSAVLQYAEVGRSSSECVSVGCWNDAGGLHEIRTCSSGGTFSAAVHRWL